MIKIKDERALLPVIRHPFADWSATQKFFIPIYLKFIESSVDEDEYKGWSFSMKFIKETSSMYQESFEAIDTTRIIKNNDWEFAPSLRNRNDSILKYNNTIIVIHQDSWLWFE